jgi:hypothetical protein
MRGQKGKPINRLNGLIMKILLAIIIIMATVPASAQIIESSSHSTTGYIKSDGTIENSSHGALG